MQFLHSKFMINLIVNDKLSQCRLKFTVSSHGSILEISVFVSNWIKIFLVPLDYGRIRKLLQDSRLEHCSFVSNSFPSPNKNLFSFEIFDFSFEWFLFFCRMNFNIQLRAMIIFMFVFPSGVSHCRRGENYIFNF